MHFSAAEWHRARRRSILKDHPEARALVDGPTDTWVFALGLAILPAYGATVWNAPTFSAPEWIAALWGIGSLRSSWAVYCSHAISHGRWRDLVGQYGSNQWNAVLATANIGTLFGILPGYWIQHNTHHTKLGALGVLDARERSRDGRPTDGDIGLSRLILHSAPSRKYSLALGGDHEGGDDGFVPRMNEALFQALSVALHAVAPLLFAVSIGLRSAPADGADPAVSRSLAIQAAASLAGWTAVAAASVAEGSAAPMLFYVGSQVLWLSPLNPNWLWTCPHLCEKGSAQPTVSFYTPDDAVGAAIDAYCGYENYHVEHHDFPELPMYLLPRLRRIAPEHYEPLRSYSVLDPNAWVESATGEFFYACQDTLYDSE